MKTYDIVLKTFNLKRVDIARQCLSGLFKLTDEQAQNILNQAPVIVLERVLKKEAHVVSKELKNGGIIVKRYPAGQMGKKVSRIVWPTPPSIHVPGTPKIRKIKTTILRVVRKTQPQGPKGTLLGIEFNAGILKMIKFSEERDGLKTDRVVVSQLNELSDEEIVSQIKTIIHEYKMQSEHIIGVLPREYTTARMLDFPSADDTEIENMVRFQAVKMVPFSKEEMIVDFQVLGAAQEGFSRVVVFIVKRDIIERYLGIFAKSNLFPTRLTINTSEMCAALGNYFKEIRLNETSSTVVIDLDYRNSNILVFNHQWPLITRSVDIGLVDLDDRTLPRTQIENACQQLAVEIRTTITAVRKDLKRQKLDQIVVVTGSESIFTCLKTYVQSFGENLKRIDSSLPLKRKITAHKKDVSEFVSFLGCMGLLVRSKKRPVNLMPKELLEKRKHIQLRQNIQRLAFLSGVLLVSLGLVFGGHLGRYKKYIQALKFKVESFGPQARKIEVMKKRLSILNDQFAPEKSVLNVLKELYRLIPDDVFINQFEFEDSRVVSIRGSAKNRVDVYAMVKTMDESGLFENIELRGGISTRKIRQEVLYDFNIYGKIKTNMKKAN